MVEAGEGEEMSEQMFWIGTGVSALIAFGATFSGVYLSFMKESSRRRKEQKEHFAQMLLGLIHESANNKNMLENIKKVTLPGTIYAGEVSTDVLQSSLRDPLFHRWASNSLVFAATIAKSRLAEMNNILSDYRARGRMESGDVERLRIRAEKRQENIQVLQELLAEAFDEYGGTVVRDKREQEIVEQFNRILREEREKTR